MQISVDNPQFQTLIFSVIFLMALLVSVKKAKEGAFFNVSLTNELKGFAILAVVFSHIGYFLSRDTQFLFPLSVLAGVGVNLFLFLSGFGITSSALKTPTPIIGFYKKRLGKLFVPMWAVVLVFFITDTLILHKTYNFARIIQSFLGFFPRGDLWLDLNSPLWYFTLILFYYLIFPLLFWKKFPWFSTVLIFLAGILMVRLSLPVAVGVLNLYKIHLFAFPLGMLFALVITNEKFKAVANNFNTKLNMQRLAKAALYVLLISSLVYIFAYTAINSGVGQGLKIEQAISLVTMFSIIFIFLMKKFSSRLLALFGIYSYEIYLVHWPLLSRYDLFYQYLPGSVATVIYLLSFIGLGFCLQKLTKILLPR